MWNEPARTGKTMIGAGARRSISSGVALVLMALIGSACSAGSSGSAASSSVGAAATGPSTAPTPTPLVLPSGVAIVTGMHSCREALAGTDTPVGDITQRRGQVFRCTWNVSDPRIQGTGVSLISADIAADGSAVVWAQDVTWNEGGTWVGRVTGTKDAAGVHWLTLTSVGTGAYAGLRYSDTESGPGDTWPVTGRIEPIEVVPASPSTTQAGGGSPSGGSGTCHEVIAATSVRPRQARAWVFDCDVTNSDPRVDGRQLVLVNADVHADGTASLWGTTVIWNEQGTWDGAWTGSAGPGWPGGERTWTGALVGSDAFHGLTYRLVTTTKDGVGIVTSGLVPTTN